MILRESNPTERVAYITYLLVRGEGLTTADVSQLTAVSQRAAQVMLNKMARTVPIYRDDSGQWRALAEDDPFAVSISPM